MSYVAAIEQLNEGLIAPMVPISPYQVSAVGPKQVLDFETRNSSVKETHEGQKQTLIFAVDK